MSSIPPNTVDSKSLREFAQETANRMIQDVLSASQAADERIRGLVAAMQADREAALADPTDTRYSLPNENDV